MFGSPNRIVLCVIFATFPGRERQFTRNPRKFPKTAALSGGFGHPFPERLGQRPTLERPPVFSYRFGVEIGAWNPKCGAIRSRLCLFSTRGLGPSFVWLSVSWQGGVL